jgi:hypothetical protein
MILASSAHHRLYTADSTGGFVGATPRAPGRLGALGAGEPVGRPAGDVVPGRFAGTHTFSGLIRFHRVDSDRN